MECAPVLLQGQASKWERPAMQRDLAFINVVVQRRSWLLLHQQAVQVPQS